MKLKNPESDDGILTLEGKAKIPRGFEIGKMPAPEITTITNGTGSGAGEIVGTVPEIPQDFLEIERDAPGTHKLLKILQEKCGGTITTERQFGTGIPIAFLLNADIPKRKEGKDSVDLEIHFMKKEDGTGIETSKGVQIGYANFSETNFSETNLEASDLRGGDFEVASFRRANLRSAKLNAAILREADFSEADLRGAALVEVDIRQANLEGALLDLGTEIPLLVDLGQFLETKFWDKEKNEAVAMTPEILSKLFWIGGIGNTKIVLEPEKKYLVQKALENKTIPQCTFVGTDGKPLKTIPTGVKFSSDGTNWINGEHLRSDGFSWTFPSENF